MSTKVIRISDLKNGKCIPLSEILGSIPNGGKLNWVLLWFDVTPKEKEGESLSELQKRTQASDEGLPYTFESLLELSGKIFQEIEVLIIGCKNKKTLHRYKNDQEMYENCDIVIEMIDGGFWEVYSKDPGFLNRLQKKFQEIEILQT